jgi:hypothetical protein
MGHPAPEEAGIAPPDAPAHRDPAFRDADAVELEPPPEHGVPGVFGVIAAKKDDVHLSPPAK